MWNPNVSYACNICFIYLSFTPAHWHYFRPFLEFFFYMGSRYLLFVVTEAAVSIVASRSFGDVHVRQCAGSPLF